MRRLLATAAFVWAGIETSGANFCRPEWQESTHYPQRYFQAPSDSWISPETVFAVIATAIIFFWLGKMSSLPRGVDKKAVLDAINDAFGGRQSEATTHTRPKFVGPIEAARKATLKALEKLGLVESGWR